MAISAIEARLAEKLEQVQARSSKDTNKGWGENRKALVAVATTLRAVRLGLEKLAGRPEPDIGSVLEGLSRLGRVIAVLGTAVKAVAAKPERDFAKDIEPVRREILAALAAGESKMLGLIEDLSQQVVRLGKEREVRLAKLLDSVLQQVEKLDVGLAKNNHQKQLEQIAGTIDVRLNAIEARLAKSRPVMQELHSLVAEINMSYEVTRDREGIITGFRPARATH